MDLKQLKISSDDRRLIGVPGKQLLNFKLSNMILIASFFWRLTPTLDLKQLELSSDDRRLIGVPGKQLLNFKLSNMILIASFFWRLTPC
ncbi:hypothetical protein B4U81_25125 [Vibrio campbellii]|nr:hypothetical protein B4U81_25125 [Vibrio campbellii]